MKHTSDFGDIGKSTVGLPGPLRDIRTFSAQKIGQLIDGMRLTGTDIEGFILDVAVCRRGQSLHDVAHISEIARLPAISDDGQRLACQLLPQEDAKNGSVSPGCAGARAINIEEAAGNNRHLEYLAPSHFVKA